MRIGGVSVGKVKSIELAPADKRVERQGHDRGGDRDRARVRADLHRRAGDPAPEDAARRDVRRAHLRHQARTSRGRRSRWAPRPTSPTREPRTSDAIPEGGTLGVGQTEDATQIDEIFNALDKQTRTAFQQLAGRTPPSRSTAAASTSTTPSATSARSSPTPRTCRRPRAARRTALQGLVRDTGTVFDAPQRARPGARRGDHGLRPDLRRARLREPGARARPSRSCPTFQHESRATLAAARPASRPTRGR